MSRRFVSVLLVILLMASFLVVSPQIASATTYLVTNTDDSGIGSLREAISQANANVGPDTITFDNTAFPAGAPTTIALASALVLSDTTGGTTIEGDGRVILTSNSAPSDTDRRTCIVVESNNNVIRGLQIVGFWVGVDFNSGNVTQNNVIGGIEPSQRNVISNNLHAGIRLYGTDNAYNLVIGNYIGTNATGTAVLGIQDRGVALDNGAHDNIIGGTTPGERNIISGNHWVGVVISGSGTADNHVRGNYIGTDYTGTLAIPNNQGGVGIDLNATGNVIGGTISGAGNVISGNNATTPHGIRISRTSGNYVYGNIIGLTADGTASLENGRGIQLEYGANNNFIGGTTANMRNIISGEGNAGICLYKSNGNTIQGNHIGTDIAGTKAIGPDYTGIIVDNSADNLIGGTVGSARNLISGNHYYGIHIYGNESINNTIVGNYIGCDTTGTLSLGNQNDGVRIGGSATNNIIGGATEGARNVISGNLHYGVAIQHAGTTGNQILGNYIGTDYTGTLDLGNGEIGIILDESPSGNIIGGTAVGAGNLISGNEGTGIQIGNFASYTLVLGNLIGTDKTGTTAIPNASAGGGYGIMIGGSADNNTVGGNTPGALNVISGNSRANNGIGVGILSDAKNNLITGNYIGTDVTGTAMLGNDYGIHIWCAQNNTISNNVIHYNTARGVNIDNIGALNNKITQNSITGNDGTAPEGGIWLANGANQGIPPPIITSVTSNTVIGTASAPDGSIVEIFQDTGCQGDVYIGSATVLANNFIFTGSAPSGATGGNLTATVTNPSGSTSKFSVPVLNNLGTSSPPEQQIEEIQEIFDDAISTGNLVGEGPGSSASGRIKALGNMLERAEELIDQGLIVEAIQQLEDAYKRVDGKPKPPDFATGSEASALAEMIENLIDNLRNH